MTSLDREPDPRSLSAGHEVRDVNVRGILALGVATVVGVAFVMVGLWGLLRQTEISIERDSPPRSPLAAADLLPPPPRLQGTPILDYDLYQAEQQAVLDSYGWVDRPQGVVRIPIDRAMDLYLQHTASPTVGPPTVEPQPDAEVQP